MGKGKMNRMSKKKPIRKIQLNVDAWLDAVLAPKNGALPA
jgi:hypothetical protein